MPTDIETEEMHMEVLPPSAIESISRAEIDMQIATAMRFPRKLSKVKSDMLSFATLDQETAENCFYTLPRGGKSIQGPSVRLAEIAVSCYGNLRAGTRIVETVTSGDSPHVVIQAVCHDLEKNVAVTIEKRRRIVGKKSKGGKIDEDDINLAANAGSAIAFRDAVFKVVPGALIGPVYEHAKKVAIGDAKTLQTRRASAIEAFGKMGVTPDRVLHQIGRNSIEEVTVSDLETLYGLRTAIKDGHTSIEAAFPLVQKSTIPNFEDEPPSAEEEVGQTKQSTIAEGTKCDGNHAAPPCLDPECWLGARPDLQEALSEALNDLDWKEDRFINGLRMLEVKGIAKQAKSVADLSDAVCEQVFKEGLDGVILAIEGAEEKRK